MNAKLLFLIASIVVFIVAALGVKTDFNLLAIGLVLFACSFLPV